MLESLLRRGTVHTASPCVRFAGREAAEHRFGHFCRGRTYRIWSKRISTPYFCVSQPEAYAVQWASCVRCLVSVMPTGTTRSAPRVWWSHCLQAGSYLQRVRSSSATGVVWVPLLRWWRPLLLGIYWRWESLSHMSWAHLILLPKYCRTAPCTGFNLPIQSFAWDLGKLGIWVRSAALPVLPRVEVLGKEAESFPHLSPCPHKIFQVEQTDVSGSLWYWR